MKGSVWKGYLFFEYELVKTNQERGDNMKLQKNNKFAYGFIDAVGKYYGCFGAGK